jgi:hypothetical protein
MNRVLSLLASKIVIVLIPALATVFLVYLRFHATLLDFAPSWNDEIFYWHQAQSFRAVAFGNGYYVFNELPAKAAFSHYGPHGPLFPVLYGSLGHIFGFHEYSGPLFNLLLLALGTLVFLCSTPYQRRDRLKIALVFLTFWPVLLYLPSNMQESLHAVAAILFAAIFYRLLCQNGAVPTGLFVCFGGVIFLFALMRPTWAVLFVPLLLYRRSEFSRRHLALSCVLGVLLAAVVFVVFQLFSAPYPNFMSTVADGGQHSAGGSLAVFLSHFADNMRGLINFRNGASMEVLLRYQTIIVLLLLALAAWRHLPRLRGMDRYAAFHLINLGIPMVFVVLFYDVAEWRDYRVLAPHLLLSLLLWCTLGQSKLVYLISTTNLLFSLGFGVAFSRIHTEQFVPYTPTTPWPQALSYKPERNAWCNTLLTDAPLDRRLMNLPAGFGMSFILRTREFKAPVKSRYLLLSDKGYDGLKDGLHVKRMLKTDLGTLYRNLDCDCDVAAPANKFAAEGPSAKCPSSGTQRYLLLVSAQADTWRHSRPSAANLFAGGAAPSAT